MAQGQTVLMVSSGLTLLTSKTRPDGRLMRMAKLCPWCSTSLQHEPNRHQALVSMQSGRILRAGHGAGAPWARGTDLLKYVLQLQQHLTAQHIMLQMVVVHTLQAASPRRLAGSSGCGGAPRLQSAKA